MTTELNYYALNVQGYGEYYEYAPTALEAIKQVRKDLRNETIGSITARRAVYGEWECGLKNYTLAGHQQH
jgi:hypothetical protein